MAESGMFYKLVIDPLLMSMRRKVVAQINKGETVIDIACGTGAQVFEMATKAKNVVGIDLSESMLKVAQKEKQKRSLINVEFHRADATSLKLFHDHQFDVATMSLALHQFSSEFYSPVLNEMKRIAKRIVIVDYAVPLQNNVAGIASKTIEFLAGREHNRCFKKYYKAGGLNYILNENGLVINHSKCFGGGAFILVTCSQV